MRTTTCALARGGHVDAARFGDGVERVVDQVGPDLVELAGEAVHARQAGSASMVTATEFARAFDLSTATVLSRPRTRSTGSAAVAWSMCVKPLTAMTRPEIRIHASSMSDAKPRSEQPAAAQRSAASRAGPWIDSAKAILLSAVVTTAYTVLGGMWSVAYTDVFQLGLVAIGLAAALPFVLHGAGGVQHAWATYLAARPDGGGILPPLQPHGATLDDGVDRRLVGRVTDARLRRHPVELLFSARAVVPHAARREPDVIAGGRADDRLHGAAAVDGHRGVRVPVAGRYAARLQASPAEAMPLLFAKAVPSSIGLLGLAAIIGAVTSSFSSSILSAGSMLSWNCLKRLVWPSLTVVQMRRVIRSSILLFGALATVLALKVQSVQALWFFTSDLVFVLLFPQLLFALFDPQANRTGRSLPSRCRSS